MIHQVATPLSLKTDMTGLTHYFYCTSTFDSPLASQSVRVDPFVSAFVAESDSLCEVVCLCWAAAAEEKRRNVTQHSTMCSFSTASRLVAIPYLPYLYRIGLGFSSSIRWRRGVKILHASLNSSLRRQTMNVLERRRNRRAHYTGLVNVRYVRSTASLFYVMLRVSKAAHCLHLVWRAHMKHIQHATHRLCLQAETWNCRAGGKKKKKKNIYTTDLRTKCIWLPQKTSRMRRS